MEKGRVHKILGVPELNWLVQTLRHRYERGAGDLGRLSLSSATEPQREVLSRLLGKRLSPRAQSVSLTDIEKVLRNAGVPHSLRDSVEVLTGKIHNRRVEREKVEAAWADLHSEAKSDLTHRPELQAWLNQLSDTGLLRRISKQDLEDAERLLFQSIEILSSLPSAGISLTELAVVHTGDSHALDSGTALNRLIQCALISLSNFSGDPSRAEERRYLWDQFGVDLDELSTSVLVLNLSAQTDSLNGKTLTQHAEVGEPCRLTLRELTRHKLEFGDRYRGQVISICENPTVVAYVAEQLGPKSQPLICIEGKPRTAAAVLLRELLKSGAKLRYHGDFDWEGLRIAKNVFERFQASPWHFGANDYLNAKPGLKLKDDVAESPWDPELARMMKTSGHGVHEEALLQSICADLEAQT